MADYSATLAAMGDQIAGLKLSEAAALKEYLKEKYRIEPAAAGPIIFTPTIEPHPAIGCERPTAVTVILDGVPDATKRIGVSSARRTSSRSGRRALDPTSG